MLSYHNDPRLKELMVCEMRKHQEADQFVKGTYGESGAAGVFKGCSVGCTIDSVNRILGKSYSPSNHQALEESVGIPEWLAKLQDTLFEGLPDGEGAQFSVDFLSAIPVGVNLEPVKWKFCAFLMREGIEKVSALPALDEALREQVLGAIRGVLAVHESAINTGKWDDEAAGAARWAAREAAGAAEAARWGAREAAGAAEAAARKSALAAARKSAWAEVWAAGAEAGEATGAEWAAAWAAAYRRYADELIRLLGGIQGGN